MSNPAPSNGRPPSGPFLRRVRIRNYKSVVNCDVELGSLTLLVGRNGAGKSNFLDALRFVADALQTSLGHAVKARGGVNEIRCKGAGHQSGIAIALDLDLGDGRQAVYGFEIRPGRNVGISVEWERLNIKSVRNQGAGSKTSYYIKRSGDNQFAGVVTPTQAAVFATPPPAAPDRLFLVNTTGIPEFRAVHDALLAMGFYDFSPASMKSLQRPDAGEILSRDGGNIASVVERIGRDRPQVKERIKGYLATIVPGVSEVNRVGLGPMETLEFEEKAEGSRPPRKFYADSMSDGTLRALGALVAVAQLADGNVPVRLVGIEEPETALHPAAAGVLMDALREAAVHTQVVVTTHSPDLLDQLDPDSDRLLVVQSRGGDTEIGPIDPASRQILKEHLYSPGELLRMDQLEPDRSDLERQRLTEFEDARGLE